MPILSSLPSCSGAWKTLASSDKGGALEDAMPPRHLAYAATVVSITAPISTKDSAIAGESDMDVLVEVLANDLALKALLGGL